MKRPSDRFRVNGRDVLIYPFWNLIVWTECCKCKSDFVRECGWTYDEWLNKQTIKTVCAECCNTAQEVADFFLALDEEERNNKPSPPPAPPKKRGRFEGPGDYKVL
jgi:hypothetical protein